MKTILSAVTVVGIVAAAGSGYAQSGADVVKTKGCFACHAPDEKKVGPSYKDLAAKYSGDKAAEGKLVAKLKEGKAHPKTAASDAELKAAVAYILSVK
jgi:cytochrome c